MGKIAGKSELGGRKCLPLVLFDLNIEDGQYFENVTPPIVIPIKAGKCTYILIEVEGYQDWEQAFCPTNPQNLPVNIRLVPVDIPMPEKQTG